MYGNGLPLLSTLCEKSPWRSRAVGTVAKRMLGGVNRLWNSWLQKKNSFCFRIGPPAV